MRKLVALTTLAVGVLFILVPRYILPACEFAGFSHMHCSDTAQVERIFGVLLIGVSCATIVVNWKLMPLVSAVLSLVVFGLAYWIPDKIGYCQSPRMPCHYGMVPAVRLLSIIGVLIMVGAVIITAKSYGKKGST
jgi:hypothetical protein